MDFILRKTTISIIFICLVLGAYSQKRISISNNSVNSIENNRLINTFSLPETNVVHSNLFVNKSRLLLTYSTSDSINVIHSVQSDFMFRRWSNNQMTINLKGEYKYSSKIFPTMYTTKRYPIYLFYGDSVLYYSSMSSLRSEWSNNNLLSNTLGEINSVVGVLSGSDQCNYVIVNSRFDSGESAIVSLCSKNGEKWCLPSLATKNNLHKLYAWDVARSSKTGIAYMILTDRDYLPYLSKSRDGGKTWSYPQAISKTLSGDSYKLSIVKGNVTVAFRCKGNRYTNNSLLNNTNNDIVMWHGTLSDFESGDKGGALMKIIDNDYNFSNEDFTLEDMAFYKNRKYFILIKNHDESGSTMQIRLIKRKL